VLENLVAVNPGAWWWIKADGTDVVKGLWESVKGKWEGDVDLNDGLLQSFRLDFEQRIKWIEGLGLEHRMGIDTVLNDLLSGLEKISSDLEFIHTGTQ
jgi:hypothetical protein